MVLPMASSDPSERTAWEPSPVVTQPVVIRQGGNGVGVVLAALILAGAAIYAVNTLKNRPEQVKPGVTPEQIQQGLERVKGVAGQALEGRN